MKTDTGGRFTNRLTAQTLALILAGGRGSRLKQLTSWQAKPATPFGGNFRIIDFPLSNCMNSGIRRVGVLTQYKAHSLILHIQRAWGFLHGEFDEFVELLPAQQRLASSWYQGTADAVFQNLDIIAHHNPAYVLILAGDHIYKMDYGPMIADHVRHRADITVACVEVAPEQSREFGIMTVDSYHQVLSFAEKPAQPILIPGRKDAALASMGIYVANADILEKILSEDASKADSSHDFGHDIIPKMIRHYRIFAYPFQDVQTGRQSYWRDVGTVDAFWQANIELTDVTPALNLYDQRWPIWTYQAPLPPAKFVFNADGRRGMAVDSLVSGGCVISGAYVDRSLLFCNVRVEAHTRISHSVILPEVTIGPDCRLRKVIIDRGCVLPEKMIIGENQAADRERFFVTENGVVLVTPEMLGQKPNKVA